jgi:hypothetical protein
MQLYNLARMLTSTTGTGTLTLTGPVQSFLSFAQAGAQDGDAIRYSVEDGYSREIGWGIYTAAGQTLTRNVDASTNNNLPVNLVAGAQVSITAAAEDFAFSMDGGTY